MSVALIKVGTSFLANLYESVALHGVIASEIMLICKVMGPILV